jgi:Uma2 family endonuclease
MAVHESHRSHHRKLTYEDYVHFPDDGKRHEILDGEHWVTPAPSIRHQWVLTRLTARLETFAEDRQLGRVLVAPTDVLLSEHDIVQPDLLFVANERLGAFTEQNLQGAPDLAIEVLSPSTRIQDEQVKLERYERTGVREYWIVDPWRQTIRIFRRQAEGFGPAEELSQSDVLSTPLLPGLALPLSKIFA